MHTTRWNFRSSARPTGGRRKPSLRGKGEGEAAREEEEEEEEEGWSDGG